MTGETSTLIAYRLQRAREALDEADLLLDRNHINTFVNRVYYACFYSVTALLLTRDLPLPSTAASDPCFTSIL